MLQSVVNKRNNCKAVFDGTLSWYFVEHKNVWHRFAAIIFGGTPARKGLMEKALLLHVCSMSSSSESNVDCVAKSPSKRRRVDVI